VVGVRCATIARRCVSVRYELNHSEMAVSQHILADKTAYDSGYAAVRLYERPRSDGAISDPQQ
jgi:hypothetical protein